MPYCTKTDILNTGLSFMELSQLTSDTPNVVNDNVVDAAIVKADDEIDSYLGVRFAVPVYPVPSRVNTWSIGLAKYNLFEGRVHRLGEIPEAIKTLRSQIVNQLKDAARGLLSLGIDPPAPPKSTGQPKVETHVGDKEKSRDFSKGKLKGF